MRHRLVLALAAAFAAAGCDVSALLNPTWVRPALVMTASGETVHIVAPDTVVRSASFQVELFTFGGCHGVEASRTDVRNVAADTVEILPYDREGTFPCGGDVLKLFRHVVSITLDVPGRSVIRVVGQREVPDNDTRPPAVVERTIIVR